MPSGYKTHCKVPLSIRTVKFNVLNYQLTSKLSNSPPRIPIWGVIPQRYAIIWHFTVSRTV